MVSTVAAAFWSGGVVEAKVMFWSWRRVPVDVRPWGFIVKSLRYRVESVQSDGISA